MANWKKVIVSGSQAELNSLALDTALTVANGGTGASTLTDGGVLLGSGTGAITATSVLTNGQLIIGDGTGDPTVATLTAGTGVSITNGAGSIEISAAGSGGTVTSVAIAGTDGIDVDSGSPITGAGTITLGLSNIANDKLANSTVSYGGVSLALGGTDATPAFNLTDATSFNKIAFKYKENDFALWVNGVEVGTDTSGITFTSSTLNKLSFDRGDGSNPLFSKVKQLQVYKTALTDTQLAALTS